MRRIPPLTAVRVFEAAARHENFTLAAAELGMTQAAVSYQIRLLEERLGAPLFVRAKRRVTLTEAGKKAAPILSSAFDMIGEAFASASAGNERVLTISAAETFASNWLAARLGAFQLEQPKLAVRLHASNTLVDLAGDEIDVAVRSGSGVWKGLRTHFLFRTHFAPLCSPGFAERHRLAGPEDVLAAARLSPEDVWWKEWLAQAGVAEEDRPQPPGIRLDSQLIEGQAAIAGQGLAILTPLLWRADMAMGRLVMPIPLVAFGQSNHWLVYPEARRNGPKIRAFRDWLLRAFAAEAEAGPADVFAPPGLARDPALPS